MADEGDLVEPEDASVQGLPAGGLADPVSARDFQDHQFYLAYWLIGVNVVLTVGVGIIAWQATDVVWTRVSSETGFLLTPFHTLLGIAIGYFFASKGNK